MIKHSLIKNSKEKPPAGKKLKFAVYLFIFITAFAFYFNARIDKNIFFETGNSFYGSYIAARFAESQSMDDKARDLIDKSLETEPKNPGLLYKAMTASLREADFKNAERFAIRLLEIDKNSNLANIVVAATAIKQNNFDKAKKLLTPVAKEKVNAQNDISGLIIPLMLVWTHVEEKNYQSALAKIDEMIEESPFDQFLHYQAALVSDIAGKKDRAEKEFKSTLDNTETKSYRFVEAAVSFYKRIGKEDVVKKLYETYLESHLKLSNYSSLPITNKAIATNGKEGIAEILAEMGAFLNENGFTGDAIEYLQLALFLRGDLAHAQYILGMILSNEEKYLRANGLLEKINPSSPYNWKGRIKAAINYYKMNEKTKAKNILLSMAEERKDSYDSLIALADILVEESRFKDAIPVYNDIIKRIKEPDNTHWIIFYYRGISYERTKQWEKAEVNFLKALEIAPDQPDVLNYLAYSWLEMDKNLEQARDMLERAVKMRPSDGHIVDSYGWALYKLGDYENAAKILERAATIMPDDPTVNDHLGDSYWKLGRFIEARYQWEKALIFKPEPEHVVKIKRKIEHGLKETSRKAKS